MNFEKCHDDFLKRKEFDIPSDIEIKKEFIETWKENFNLNSTFQEETNTISQDHQVKIMKDKMECFEMTHNIVPTPVLDMKYEITVKEEPFELQENMYSINSLLKEEIGTVSQDQKVKITKDKMECFDMTHNIVPTPVLDMKYEITVKEEPFELQENMYSINSLLKEKIGTVSQDQKKCGNGYATNGQNNDEKSKFCDSLQSVNLTDFDGVIVENFNIEDTEVDFNMMRDKEAAAGHLTEINRGEKFRCYVCNHETVSMKDLVQHAKEHINHPPKGKAKILKCSECDYRTNRHDALTRHSLTHSGAKLFKCSECDYKSILKDTLKRHLLTHSNKKLFKCSECNYRSDRNCDLRRHLLTHSNTKLFTSSDRSLFKCAECNFVSNRNDNLKIHLLTHSDIKLFKCSECFYESNNKTYFNKHLLVHVKTKLFRCFECDYECNQISNLKIHLETHSDKTSPD